MPRSARPTKAPCRLTRPCRVDAGLSGLSASAGRSVSDEAWTDLGRVLATPIRGRVAHDVFGVDRGCVLRTAERPIGLDGDAPGSGPRVDQVEREVRTGIGEQSCALADDDGIGEQVELVDQAVGEQPSDEGTTAGHQQCAVLMRSQITDGRGEVAVQDGRAGPVWVGEAGRHDVLGTAVQPGGDRARAVSNLALGLTRAIAIDHAAE